ILRPEANSAYLQNFHKEFFFYLPVSLNVLHQDFSLLLYFLSSPGGHQVLALVLHGVCIFIAIIYLVSFNTSKLLLIVLPLLFLLLAAALHQYTLIKRVTLFSMPLMLVLIAIGLQQLLSVKFIAVRLTVLAFAVICFINFNALKNFIYPMQEEEMKQSLQFLKQKNIRGDELYVQQLAAPAYIYYTQIHPQKQNWTFQSGGKLFEWYTNIDSLSKTFPKGAAVLYSWDDPATIEGQQTTIRKNLALADSNLVRGGRVYIYR
ncbi:MAG: hypothetical protein JWO06_3649, partial [Bacteroidota bacterium]|nr:hypothetical protein [Bacteroidota bacterium]